MRGIRNSSPMPKGARVAVLLPLAGYETLLAELEDLRDALAAREEPAEPWEAVKARPGLP